MAPNGNSSGIGEQCIGCKKTIQISDTLKCIVCHRRCHLNCVKPKLTDEIKTAMQKNTLITFTCPDCNKTLSKHFGKINDDFLGFADKNIQENAANNKQLDNLQLEILSLGEKLKKKRIPLSSKFKITE